MKVPFVDLAAQNAQLKPQLHDAFDRVIRNSSFVQGQEVQWFEEAFARYLGDDIICIAVNSGTAALQLSLLALGIGPSDEVITVPHSFIATAEAISAVGAKPVFVDVDPVSYTMDPTKLETAITSRTRAILPVHLYGQPADMDALQTIAGTYGIPLIEDACQAHGAQHKGRRTGTIGTAGCFSFYPSKNLGCCGEGGAVVTRDPQLAQRIRLLRDHGSTRKYEHQLPGFNMRMQGLQGAVLRTKLLYLDLWNDSRRALASLYTDRLAQSDVVVPTEMSYARHVYHLYVVQLKDRDEICERLKTAQIETGLHYPTPLHLQPAYVSLGYRRGDFPVCEQLASRIVSLPMYPELSSRAVEYVADALLEALECQVLRSRAAS